MNDPVRLDYLTPGHEHKADSTPLQRGVGFFGFAIYGLLALIFDFVAFTWVYRSPNPVGGIFFWWIVAAALLGAFCTWRAFVAFWQFCH